MARRLPEILNVAQGEALITEAVRSIDAARTPTKHFAARRDLIMILTGCYAGLRVSELCDLRIEHIDLRKPIIQIKHGKGDKDRNVPIGAALLPCLEAWIDGRADGPVFPGPGGRKLCRHTFSGRLDAIAKRAGVKTKVHPHLLRHTFATSLIDKGAALHEVQQLLGHEDIRTTAIYLHVSVGRMQSAVDRL